MFAQHYGFERLKALVNTGSRHYTQLDRERKVNEMFV